MRLLKTVLDIYINGSIHVALAVYALVQLTFHFFYIPYDASMSCFAFFGTIVGYNFVKYDELTRAKKIKWSRQLEVIVGLSIVSFLATAYCFFQLEKNTKLIAIVFLLLTMLYTLPFFPKIGNARNWAGVKIYIVAFCWAGITLFLPIINADLPISQDVWLNFGQRFLLVIILILIFEIIDLKNDDLSLQTVPQRLGVYKTKVLNLILLVPFYCLESLKSDFQKQQLLINLILIIVLALFTLFASPKRSNYYTSFWVESIPVFWWALVLFFWAINSLKFNPITLFFKKLILLYDDLVIYFNTKFLFSNTLVFSFDNNILLSNNIVLIFDNNISLSNNLIFSFDNNILLSNTLVFNFDNNVLIFNNSIPDS